MPTASDLVTDLPADFETFGQAVATSMADLLGGTTGQVLSKASNTDMDFTWVAQDDSNAIQNAIVDAKGDLIAATAADTPARLAVGTNGQVLTADSTAATGIKWATPAGSGGLTKITGGTYSAVSSFNLEGIFTSTYKKYVLYLTAQPSINGSAIQSQFLYSTNTVQSSDYYGSGSRLLRDNTSSNYGFSNTAQATIADSTGDSSIPSWQLTFMNVGNSSQKANYFGQGFNTASQSYDRFTCINDVARTYTGFKVAVSAGTITGDYVVFGVQN
jgi:hypothetical protein